MRADWVASASERATICACRTRASTKPEHHHRQRLSRRDLLREPQTPVPWAHAYAHGEPFESGFQELD